MHTGRRSGGQAVNMVYLGPDQAQNRKRRKVIKKIKDSCADQFEIRSAYISCVAFLCQVSFLSILVKLPFADEGPETHTSFQRQMTKKSWSQDSNSSHTNSNHCGKAGRHTVVQKGARENKNKSCRL